MVLLVSARGQAASPPTILTVTTTKVTETNAVLQASFYPNSTAVVRAWFTWGTTTNLGNRTTAWAFKRGTNAIAFSHLLGGLATNRTYYFQCVTSNQFGVRRSALLSFKTRHDVQFQELNAVGIESDRALLTGAFTAEHSGKTWFRWGTSSNVPVIGVSTNYTAGNDIVAVSNLLSGLTPNKKHYYRLIASNQFGVSGSAISNFTTKLNFAIASVDVRFEGYMVPTEGNIIGRMDRIAECMAWFEWGTDTNAPSSSTPRQPTRLLQSIWIDLPPGTLYYCRFIATNIYGRESTPWKPFVTPTGLTAVTYPAGSGNTVPTGPGYPYGIGAISSTRARLGAGIANYFASLTDAWFEWGTSTNYENRTAIVASGFNGFEAFTELSGLQEAGAVYHYRVVASNSIGMAIGEDRTFSTPLFPVSMASSHLPGVTDGRAIAADFDGDGLLDVALGGISVAGGIFQVWLNRVTNFVLVTTNLPGLPRSSLSGGDYDNDGRVDILAGGPGGQFWIWRNEFLSFSNAVAEWFDCFGYSCNLPVWGDCDNDGRIDIVGERWDEVGGERLTVWRNTIEGLSLLPIKPLSLVDSSAGLADYDNDGWLDLLLTGSRIGVTELLKNALGNFTSVTHPITATSGGSIDWGDYDNDGRLDAVISGSSICAVWRNTPESFSNVNAGLPSLADDLTRASARWGDYDNDGKLDLLLYGYNADGVPRIDPEFICQIWRNTGTGFTNINAGFPSLLNGSAAWGDYDNDGRLDVLMTGQGYWSGEPVTHIYRNVHVPPNSPPTAPTGLQVLQMEFGVAFTWLAASDAQTPSSGLSYNLRVGSAPGQCDLVAPNALADGTRLLVQFGNAQMRRFAYLTGLTNGQTVYWTVQAIDTAFAGGAFAQEQSFVYPAGDWSRPALSIERGTAKLRFASPLPLAYVIFSSSNLVDWERLGEPAETVPGDYEMQVQPEGQSRFFQLRWP